MNTLRRDDIMPSIARQSRGCLHEKSELQNDGSQSTERSSCLCFKGCPCSVLLDSWALPRGKLLDWLSLATRYSRGRYFLFIAHLGFLKIEVWKGNLSFLSHIGCYDENIVLVFWGGGCVGKCDVDASVDKKSESWGHYGGEDFRCFRFISWENDKEKDSWHNCHRGWNIEGSSNADFILIINWQSSCSTPGSRHKYPFPGRGLEESWSAFGKGLSHWWWHQHNC